MSRLLPLVLWALGFAAAGLALRHELHTEIETRALIAIFWLAAIALELVVKPMLTLRGSRASIIINGSVATVSIIAMKWIIEGVHPLLRMLVGG